MKIKNLILTALFLFMLISPASAGDDFQYWSQYLFKIVDTKKVDFSIYAEGRFNDNVGSNALNLIAGKIKYQFWKNLDLGTNYTYLEYKSRSEFKYQHRAELEINPKFNIGDFAKFYNRNRIEFRWIEDKGSYNTRSRHRFGLSFPLKKVDWLKDIYFNSEFFYNWAENDYDENRTVPIGLTFKINDKTALKTYYMIQSRSASNDWYSNQVLGTLLSVKF